MRRDAHGLLHLSVVVFGPWSSALGQDIRCFHAGLPAHVDRSAIAMVEEGNAWFLRFECHLPAKGDREAIRLEVSTKSGTIGAPEIEEHLLRNADGVIFAVDTTIPNETFTMMQLEVLERIRPPAVVFQFDRMKYVDEPPMRTPEELCALLRVGDRPYIATQTWDGQGVMDTFVMLVKEMLRTCVS